MIRRRDLVAGATAFGLLTQTGALSQPRKLLVATFWTTSREVASPYVEQFEAGLAERGWAAVSGPSVEHHFTGGDPAKLDSLAGRVVALRPDVIMSGLATGGVALRKFTTEIPIVVAISVDPIAAGLADSIARPGRNVTGSVIPHDATARRLQMMREIFPLVRRIAIVHNRLAPNVPQAMNELSLAAKEIGAEIRPASLSSPEDLPSALQSVLDNNCDSILILANDNLAFLLRKQIVAFALRHKIANVGASVESVRDGALLSYGPSLSALFRRSAYFVDRILRGARPADLPFEYATKYDLAINLQTSRALGLSIPSHILALADEVVE